MAELENQKEFHRGEVWWIDDPGRYEYEYGGGRPAVIVSSEKGCERSPTIQVIFLTTSTKYGVLNVPIYSGDKPRTAMCGTVTTFSKERAGRCMSKVTPEELAEIDRGLMAALGLNGVEMPDNSENESEIERLNEEILAKDLEIAMFRKLYEKTMDQLVSVKFDTDLHRKQNVSAPLAKPKVELHDPGYEPVDVNRCKVEELQNIGVSAPLAKQIIAGRPYKSVEDLRIVPGMTKVGYGIVSKKVTVGDISEYILPKKPPVKVEKKQETPPVKTEKVNVNTATAEEIVVGCGLGRTQAYTITGYRKKNGPFTSLEDLLKVPRIYPGTLEKYRDKLEV